MNARNRPYKFTDRLLPIRPLHFFVLAALCLVVAVFALRSNYTHMESLRAAVYTADEKNGDVQGTLNNLQHYVTAHMNTNLSKGNNSVYPPIQLKYTYDRLRESELSESNSQVYTAAQAYCEQQNSTDFSGKNRVPCIESYVEAHGVYQKPVPDSLYKFDFISPTWSPDLAGISLLLAVVFLLIGAGWLVARRLLKN
jgi:hypothetical protein